MRARLAWVGALGVWWVFAQACGGDGGADLDGGNDGTVNDVAAPDTSGNDVVTNPDTGPADAGPDDTGTDASDASTVETGPDTGIAQWTCGSVKVTDCSQCTGFVQPCAFCNVQDASVLLGVCVQQGTNCLNAIPNNQFQDCVCADAATCPEAFQVCTNTGRCHTCTDSTQNSGLKCENALTCAADAGCK